MTNFYIRKIIPENAEEVIQDVGFDKLYINYVLPKYNYSLLKIHNLSSPEANILKQLALSVGADAAVHREVITCKVYKSDILLGATHSQLKKLSEKLKHQPFKLKELSPLLLKQIENNIPYSINVRDTVFDLSKKTYIMGILNITPDSFSDGGKFIYPEVAIYQVNKMIESNVDIIDVGGESTRPYAKEVSPEEELDRVLPVIKKIREINPKIPISIDTRHALVAREAVKCGADIINDVSGLDFDANMLNTAAELQVPVIIMHSHGTPETMQENPVYPENIMDAISKSLYDKTENAVKAGIKKENIIIDPGIGFGKTFEHNIEIIKRISELKSLGFPLMVGISRKSVITKILESSTEEEKEYANIALNAYLASNGVNIIRVHDVEKHFRAFRVLDKIIK